MNRTILLLILLVTASHGSLIYTVDVDRSGFSSITLSMEGEEYAEVALPPDAGNLRIIGGSYQLINGSARISSGASGFTTFSFSSSSLTTKTSSGWRLSFSPAEGSSVQVYLPSYATLEDSSPQPERVSSDDSRTMVELGQPGIVSLYYRLEELPAAQGDGGSDIYLLAAAIVLAAGIVAAALILRRRPGESAPAKKAPSLDITPGKREMMETFNDNDRRIADILIARGGRMRRNELERKSGISKSSLAMALNRLEKRGIIDIDRGSTTHFVKLSDRFLRL